MHGAKTVRTLACLGLAFVALTTAAGCSSDSSGSDSGGAAASPEQPQFQQGDCLRFAGGEAGGDSAGGDAGNSIKPTDCSQAHHGEVVLSSEDFFGEDKALPPEARLQSIADTACTEAMSAYSGATPQQASVRMSFLYPTQETWAAGDRRLTCIAVSWDAQADSMAEVVGSLAPAG